MAITLWAAFIGFILLFMLVDLFVFGRRGRPITARTALSWTGVCISLALAFVPAVYWIYETKMFGMGVGSEGVRPLGGLDAATRFLQGWILEYAMSVDNLFVFALIFTHFKVPREHQHRVLTWGIIATLIMRGGMIGFAITIIHMFEWVLYLAGFFLVWTAYKMLFSEDSEFNPDQSKAVRLVRKFIPVTSTYHGDRFFVRDQSNAGRLSATPLFLVLMVLNVVDLVFAVDSVPAIISVTTDSFLVFSSNMFAILGLRALYFVLASAMDQFKYLEVSLAVILAFVGLKMLVEGAHHLRHLESRLPAWGGNLVHWIPEKPLEMSPLVSLGVIVLCLVAGIGASMIANRRAAAR